ncbi:2-amino-4-hydroxy-6-hydroxymethyldihydropteridine diphosphokinase [Spirochaetia bacterium]|nr:2-amino-4-hydroxy-6-hydroxymethyldihydropteridine diphosphokinase [Spirochaetia bacterium]
MNDSDFGHTSYIALGSNMGSKERHITHALELLNGDPAVRITALSKMYKTEPVGYTDQDFFLNMVCCVRTSLEPDKLLDVLHKIENDLERTRTIRWGPRTIDLDILLYDDVQSDNPVLTIPHPRMFERAFVMVPLRDVYNSGAIKNKPLDEIIAGCADRGGVVFYKSVEMSDLDC